TYSYGNGQASFAIHLAEGLAALGHQVMVVTTSKVMRSYSECINGVQVERVAALPLPFIHPVIQLTLLPAPQARQYYEKFKPDIVHIQDHYFMCASILREARRRGIPTVGTNHFLPQNILPFLRDQPALQNLAARLLWKMMLAVYNRLDAATAPSETAVKILLQQAIRVPVTAISNGVDIQVFRPNPEVNRSLIRHTYSIAPDRPVFLYVGRMDGEKRLDLLLQAASQLPLENFQLALVGYGLQEQALRQQARDLGLGAHVSFVGYVPPADLPALYNSADVFVMPSPEELQSIATLEALACGKPILAADARALPELVQPGINGYLFRPGDSASAAGGMKRMLDSRDEWPRMGQCAVEGVQRHSLTRSIQKFEDLYRSVVEKRGRLQLAA
ncbi:MAG TPA: glycosyltransferase, partial [Anaerolineales bacterium]